MKKVPFDWWCERMARWCRDKKAKVHYSVVSGERWFICFAFTWKKKHK